MSDSVIINIANMIHNLMESEVSNWEKQLLDFGMPVSVEDRIFNGLMTLVVFAGVTSFALWMTKN